MEYQHFNYKIVQDFFNFFLIYLKQMIVSQVKWQTELINFDERKEIMS